MALPTVQSPGNSARVEIMELGPWFHNLHLPDGTQTAPDHPLGDFPACKWAQLASSIPADLSGWTALDVGCNAGYYSFQLATRGAEVTGLDIDAHYLRQARWAADQLGARGRLRFEQGSVYDLARRAGRYDLIWFMGVLYHLRYPLLALDILRQKVKRLLVLQTLTLPGEEVAEIPADLPLDRRHALLAPGWPRLAFVERQLAGDPTNWWVPNHACVEAMLRASGFRVLARPGHEIYVCTLDDADRQETERRVQELRSVTGPLAP